MAKFIERIIVRLTPTNPDNKIRSDAAHGSQTPNPGGSIA